MAASQTKTMKNGMMKALVAALATLVTLAPGATAVGALDASGALSATGQATADLSGVTQTVNGLAATAEGAANAALQTVNDVKIEADLDASLDAQEHVDGAAGAGVGFFATAKGAVADLFAKIRGLFGGAKAEAEGAVDAIAETAADAQADVEARADAQADAAIAAAQSVEAPEVEAPRAPAARVAPSLTASLQAALTGLIALGN